MTSSELHLSPKSLYIVIGRSFLKANNVLHFGHFVGNTNWLDVTEMTEIAISFQCDTRNAFSTPSCRTAAEINVKMVVQNVGKDPEQNLLGCLDECKINSRILVL